MPHFCGIGVHGNRSLPLESQFTPEKSLELASRAAGRKDLASF